MSTRTLYRPVTHNHAEPGVEREFRQIYKILNRLGAPQVQRAAAVPQRAAPVAAAAPVLFSDRVAVDVLRGGTGGTGYWATFANMETERVVVAECLLSLQRQSLHWDFNDVENVFYMAYARDWEMRGDTIRIFVNDQYGSEPPYLDMTLMAQAIYPMPSSSLEEIKLARDQLEWGDTVSAQFRFNEGTGRVIYDYNIHGHNMAPGAPGPFIAPGTNVPTWTDKGLKFEYDGTNADEAYHATSIAFNRKGQIPVNGELPHKDSDNFTVFWIADADLTTGTGNRWGFLLSRTSGSHPLHWGFGYLDGRPFAAVSNSGGTSTTSISAPSAVSEGPHLHTLTYDKVNLKLYVDGVEIASTPLTIGVRDGNQFFHSFKSATAQTNRYTGTVYYGYGVKYAMTDTKRQETEVTLREIMTIRGVTLP